MYIEDFVFFCGSDTEKVPAKGTFKNDLEMKSEFRLFVRDALYAPPVQLSTHVMTLNFPYPALVAGVLSI